MKKKLLISGWLACVIISLQAQIPDDFIRIDASEIAGLKISQERTFTKESLFGYMNGGAELYLEYGFERLVVSDLDYNGNTLKVEVYKMPDVDMAFGIYSVNIFRCEFIDGPSDHYCESAYQVQFCRGDYYVNIINNGGTQDGLEVAKIIAGQLTEDIKGDSFSFESYIPEDFLPDTIDKILLIAGDIALGNYAFEYAEYLEYFSDYILLLVESVDESMLIIRFNSGDQLEEFRNMMGIDQFPVCGEKIPLDNFSLSLTNMGDIILHFDLE